MRISYLRDIIIILILLTFWISDLLRIGAKKTLALESKTLLIKYTEEI